jgi:hypothetical protein
VCQYIFYYQVTLPLPIHGPRNMGEDLLLSRDVLRIPSVVKYFVHLLQRLAVRLWYEEPCPCEREKAENCEESICPESGILDKRWSNDTLSR